MADKAAAELVRRLRFKDPQALREAYDLFKHDVVAVAAAMLGPAGADRAWDVLHDVFVSLARAAENLAADSNLRAYLVRAAVNRARDCLARERRYLHDNKALEVVPSVGPGALALIEQDEQARDLWNAVESLPAEQRIVVSLRIWGDLSFREIAEAESISENTAQSRFRYALQKLRRQYEGVEP